MLPAQLLHHVENDCAEIAVVLLRDATLALARHHGFARRLVNSGRLSVPATLHGSALNTPDRDAFAGAIKRIAYERLLLDLVEGDQTLFVRRDEVEAQWEWIDAIRAGWGEAGLTPKTYTAGAWGPSAAIALAERDGVSWHE